MQKKMIEDWKIKREFLADWEILFGENFLTDIIDIKFRLYSCPHCGAQI